MATERLRVILELDASQYKRGAREAEQATDKMGKGTDKARTRTGRLKDSFRDLSTTAKFAIAGAATAAVVGFARSSIKAATDLGESINAVNKVFGDSAQSILDFGQVSAKVVGLSNREFNSLATVSGALLKNLGFGMEDTTRQTIRLTTRAADMASVFNTDVGTALEAINSGLKGEANPLEQFGVKLNDATIRAKAVELGLADTTAAVTDHGKAVATLELIYEQTEDAQGDFLQTSGDLANASRVAAATAEDNAARFGKATQAPLAALAGFGATVLDSITSFGIFGDAEAQVAAQSLRVAEAIEKIQTVSAAGGDPLTALADGLLHIAVNGELSVGQFEALAAGAGLGVDKFEDFNALLQEQGVALGLDAEVMEELEAAIVGTGDASGEAAGEMDEVTLSAEEQAEAVKEAEQAQRDLQKAFLEAASPIFAAQGSLDRYSDAQAKLIDVQEDGESTAEDIANAQLDVAAAALAAEGALVDLAGGDIQAGIGLIADALNIGDDEARALLETLGLLNGTEVESVVTTRFVTTGDRVSRDVAGGSFHATNIRRRQHGGRTERGGSFLVGEAGPEIFTPDRDGRIIPNGQVGTTGATVNENIEINFHDSRLRDDPMDAVRLALQSRRTSQSVGI